MLTWENNVTEAKHGMLGAVDAVLKEVTREQHCSRDGRRHKGEEETGRTKKEEEARRRRRKKKRRRKRHEWW